MRILLVIHDFLPKHAAGSEIYTWQLGERLLDRGHDVHVFTTEKDISRPNLSVSLRGWGRLPVHELVNNLFYNDFRETWDYPPAARSFGVFLDDLRPDVVHFMHLMYLSVGCAEEAARRGIPVLITLHDYWLQCARFGQRFHPDGSICHTIQFDRCGDCLAGFKYRQSRLERAVAKSIAGVRRSTRVDLGPAARMLADRFRARLGSRAAGAPAAPPPGASAPSERGEPRWSGDPSYQPAAPADRARMGAVVAERDRALRERLLPVVSRFVAPSHFLRERFLEWGIPAAQVEFMRTGIDLDLFRGFERTRAERVRVAFIGTLAPHKGVHVLLRAWELVPRELRARAALDLYGPGEHNPSYVRELEVLAARTGARLVGRLARDQVVNALRNIDLLVVPSIWYENSPLIILEALATRTPLLVSDQGGMSELVRDGLTGFHFRAGDAHDLAAALERVLRDPDVLHALHPTELEVQDVREDAERLERMYAAARADRQASGTEPRR